MADFSSFLLTIASSLAALKSSWVPLHQVCKGTSHKGLTNLPTTLSWRILYLDGIEALSISSQPPPASASALRSLKPRSLL